MKSNIAIVIGVMLLAVVFIVHTENTLAAIGMIAGFILIAGGLVAHEIEGGEYDDQM